MLWHRQNGTSGAPWDKSMQYQSQKTLVGNTSSFTEGEGEPGSYLGLENGAFSGLRMALRGGSGIAQPRGFCVGFGRLGPRHRQLPAHGFSRCVRHCSGANPWETPPGTSRGAARISLAVSVQECCPSGLPKRAGSSWSSSWDF